MKRPKITHEMVLAAAQNLALENKWDAVKAGELADVYEAHMDGYELAKELESSYSWDISVMDVEALDYMDCEVRNIHLAACLTWVRESDIQPPLPIGTMTTRGEITGISTHGAAEYLIRENGETNESRRLIVRFEDAQGCEA